MANNRYYIKCPVCKNEINLGKSLGNGLYNMSEYSEVLAEIYNWMWKHMMECHKDELKGGELFKIVSEYKD